MSISFRADYGDGGWQPVQADSQPKSSGMVLGRRPLGAVLRSSNKPGELSQRLCHDYSTINIVLELLFFFNPRYLGSRGILEKNYYYYY